MPGDQPPVTSYVLTSHLIQYLFQTKVSLFSDRLYGCPSLTRKRGPNENILLCDCHFHTDPLLKCSRRATAQLSNLLSTKPLLIKLDFAGRKLKSDLTRSEMDWDRDSGAGEGHFRYRPLTGESPPQLKAGPEMRAPQIPVL